MVEQVRRYDIYSENSFPDDAITGRIAASFGILPIY